MASTSAAGEQAAASPSLAHLPDASEELGRAADLSITVEGTEFKLHRPVAAAGSRVLRTDLCSCAGGSDDAAAAVQAAFQGCKLADVQLFLKLLYNPVVLEIRPAGGEAHKVPTCGQPNAWGGILSLADKLDAPGVLQACDLCIARLLRNASTGIDWMGWLQLADKLRLDRTAACCITPVVKDLLLIAGPKQRMAQLAQLGQPAAGMLLAVLAKGTLISGYHGQVAGKLPSNVDCRAPQNLF